MLHRGVRAVVISGERSEVVIFPNVYSNTCALKHPVSRISNDAKSLIATAHVVNVSCDRETPGVSGEKFTSSSCLRLLRAALDELDEPADMTGTPNRSPMSLAAPTASHATDLAPLRARVSEIREQAYERFQSGTSGILVACFLSESLDGLLCELMEESIAG